MALADQLDRFMAQGQAAGWAASTVANYRHLLQVTIQSLAGAGCRRWPDVGPSDLEDVLHAMQRDGRATKTRIQAAILIRRFFGWLMDQGLVLRNPARSLPLPHHGEFDLPTVPLSEGQVEHLLGSLPRITVIQLRNVALLELLYGCGLRISEALALNLDDVSHDQQTVLVRESKHAQTRLVPLPRTAGLVLADYLALRRELLRGPDVGAVFLSQYGTRLVRASIYKIFRQIGRNCPPEWPRLKPHLLRHSIAVHLLRRGADIRYIQAFLGHASMDTTMVYLELVPGHLREDYDGAMIQHTGYMP